jgi:hypothetical protein
MSNVPAFPSGTNVNSDMINPLYSEATVDQGVASGSAPGATVGAYRLLEIIGEGGIGEVWLAEQKQPVRRRVALKLIKAGMDTREVFARFESRAPGARPDGRSDAGKSRPPLPSQSTITPPLGLAFT